jgi:hypothetical protein
MFINKRCVSRFAALSLFSLVIFSQFACSRSPVKSVDAPQGGKIVYGEVKGADSQAAAMASLLRTVHDKCGEKPQVGKVFKVRGMDTHAVYFTVADHSAGNRHVAGMVIAAQSGPGRFEAAMVSDDASRFASTMNPMLQQLFGVWHPGEGSIAPAQAASNAPALKIPSMHKATLSDDTASVNLPDGWSIDPAIAGGGMIIEGPRGERIALNMWFSALDPNGLGYRNMRQMGIRPDPHTVIFPYDADLVKSFPDIIQKLRASNGFGPAEIQVDHAQMMSSKGSRYVQATGRINRDGKGMREFNIMLFTTKPDQYGDYAFNIFDTALAENPTDQERATAIAIVGSFQANTELIKQRVAVTMAPILAAMRKNYETQQQQLLARSQQIVGSIKQIGANATARYEQNQIANDAQHKSWNEQQDTNARNVQGYTNYILDQTVVQDNYRNKHSTEWNQTADALVKSNPDRYEIVDTPNYLKNSDF